MASLLFVRRKKSNVHEAKVGGAALQQQQQLQFQQQHYHQQQQQQQSYYASTASTAPGPGPSSQQYAITSNTRVSHQNSNSNSNSNSNTTPLYERFARKANLSFMGGQRESQTQTQQQQQEGGREKSRDRDRKSVSISRPMALGSPVNVRQEYEAMVELPPFTGFGRPGTSTGVENSNSNSTTAFSLSLYPSALQSHMQQTRAQPMSVSTHGLRASGNDRPSTAPTPTRTPAAHTAAMSHERGYAPNHVGEIGGVSPPFSTLLGSGTGQAQAQAQAQVQVPPPPVPKKSPERYLGYTNGRPKTRPVVGGEENRTRLIRGNGFDGGDGVYAGVNVNVNSRVTTPMNPNPVTSLLSPPTSPTMQRRRDDGDEVYAYGNDRPLSPPPLPTKDRGTPSPVPTSITAAATTASSFSHSHSSPSPIPNPALTPPQDSVTLPVRKNGVGVGGVNGGANHVSSVQSQSPASSRSNLSNGSGGGGGVNYTAAAAAVRPGTANSVVSLPPENRLLSDPFAKPRQPRKYSPLAAFGLPIPVTVSKSTSSTETSVSAKAEESKQETGDRDDDNKSVIRDPDLSGERPNMATQGRIDGESDNENENETNTNDDEQDEFHAPLFASNSSLGNVHQNNNNNIDLASSFSSLSLTTSPSSTSQSHISPTSPSSARSNNLHSPYRRLPSSAQVQLPPQAPPPVIPPPQSPPPQVPLPQQPESPARVVLRERSGSALSARSVSSSGFGSRTRSRTLSGSTSGSGKRDRGTGTTRQEQMATSVERPSTSVSVTTMMRELESVDESTVTPKSQKLRSGHTKDDVGGLMRHPYAQAQAQAQEEQQTQVPTPPMSRDGHPNSTMHPNTDEFGNRQLNGKGIGKGKGKQREDHTQQQNHHHHRQQPSYDVTVPSANKALNAPGVTVGRLTPGKPLIFTAVDDEGNAFISMRGQVQGKVAAVTADPGGYHQHQYSPRSSDGEKDVVVVEDLVEKRRERKVSSSRSGRATPLGGGGDSVPRHATTNGISDKVVYRRSQDMSSNPCSPREAHGTGAGAANLHLDSPSYRESRHRRIDDDDDTISSLPNSRDGADEVATTMKTKTMESGIGMSTGRETPDVGRFGKRLDGRSGGTGDAGGVDVDVGNINTHANGHSSPTKSLRVTSKRAVSASASASRPGTSPSSSPLSAPTHAAHTHINENGNGSTIGSEKEKSAANGTNGMLLGSVASVSSSWGRPSTAPHALMSSSSPSPSKSVNGHGRHHGHGHGHGQGVNHGHGLAYQQQLLQQQQQQRDGYSRRLQKTPKGETMTTTMYTQGHGQGNGHGLGSPIDLATGEAMAADADPFARVEPAVSVKQQEEVDVTVTTTAVGAGAASASVHSLVEYQGHANVPQPPVHMLNNNTHTHTNANANANVYLDVKPSTDANSGGSHLPSPVSPESYEERRVRRRGEKLERVGKEVLEVVAATTRGEGEGEGEGDEGRDSPADLEEVQEPEQETEAEPEPEPEPEPEREPTFYPLEKHLTHPSLLGTLLPYLSFRDWCALTEVNDAMRRVVEHKRELRECVLEHFLNTVGYVRWRWAGKEPIMLTFRDLNAYMRGVSVPTHQFAITANTWIESKQRGDEDRTITIQKTLLASSCRAYTRVVLRLRAQAEEEQAARMEEMQNGGVYQFTPPQSTTSVNVNANMNASRRDLSRNALSRPTSPTSSAGHSMFSSSMSHLPPSHGYHHRHQPPSAYGNANGGGSRGALMSSSTVNIPISSSSTSISPHRNGNGPPRFKSPLFRLGHAPLLRVFVPSPEGEWLGDESVVDCEKELKRAGVLPLLRVGDVVWDAAVGDEGNVGRLVWDGNYLIDLDYTYSRTGELPSYLHTLSFPPSYFHRVVRTPRNPIVYMDLSPWAEQIAANLQLLQDRIRTETPQGGHHTVVRWIHRSKFRIKTHPYGNAPIPIPNTNLTVDPAWYGTVIVETEGTNEGLADLQDRCKGGFPPRAGANPKKQPSKVFRLLRERSRPGEIWIRAVREKERLL